MENFKIKATEQTPYIDFDPAKGVLTFEGKSYPENTYKFYKPVNEWLKNYFKKTENKKIEINFDLIYLNSSSLKVLFDIFDIFDEASSLGKDIQINWFYEKENDIMEEIAEDLKEDFQTLQIDIVSK